VVNALAQLAPSTPDLVAPQVTFQGTRQFEDFWLSHLDDVMCGQVSQPDRINQPNTENASCPANGQRAGAWLKGFGYFGSQGAQDAFGAYNFNIYGTMVGYDTPLVHAPFDGVTRVGFGVGYERSTINGTTFSANTDFNTYEATAYIAHENGPWFVDGDLSVGWNDYSGTRNISFPGVTQTAQASYSGQDYTAFATTGYHFFAGGTTITPLASLQYTHMDIGSYGETGAGSIDLNVQSQHYDFLESGLGVKVADPFRYLNGTYVPEVHFKWFHELINPSAQDTAAFAVAGSPSFTTPGLKPAADTFDVGTGLTFLSCSCTARTWSIEGTYDFFWRSDSFIANQLMLRLTMRF
jgi:outer membrane autotransporter protein